MKIFIVIFFSFFIFCLWYVYIATGIWKLLLFSRLLAVNQFILSRKWVHKKVVIWYMRNIVVKYLETVGTEVKK
jgi:hypothetical protein